MKKRYTMPDEIIAEIKKARAKADQLMKDAGDSEEPSAIEMRKMATNLEKNRIPYLVQKLSELQTLPMPFLGGDRSVQA